MKRITAEDENVNCSGTKLPKFEELDSYWKDFFTRTDKEIEENLWGNLSILQEAYSNKDPYALQLKEMGYNFDEEHGKAASYYDAIAWSIHKMNQHVCNSDLKSSDILRPAKAFEVPDGSGTRIEFIPFGGKVPENAKPLNLLNPDTFVKMLSEGYFPIGDPIREHTNQTLSEHDLAHMAGFVSSPNFTRAIRQSFHTVGDKMRSNPRVKEALTKFDSLYSLRLYYMIEVFTEITGDNKKKLLDLIGIDPEKVSLEKHPESLYPEVTNHLLKLSKNPATLNKYLYKLYKAFPSIVNPVGGESRDILNRTRKYRREGQLGTFYSKMSNLESKFDGSSIYSLHQNAQATLENKRSNHKDYEAAIREIHAPFIATLLGTSQLSADDWVHSAVNETPDKNSKLNKYLCQTGIWNKAHVLYWAYCHDEYDKVLTKKDFH